MKKNLSGTLAIDLGNTNTVLAFQEENKKDPILIEIPGITTSPGVIPTVVWFQGNADSVLIGHQALEIQKKSYSNIFFHSNFKRLIGNPFEKR